VADITTAQEGAEALLMALLATYAHEPDDCEIPLRDLFIEIGRGCGVEMLLGERLSLEETITLGEFRKRIRMARRGLAESELADA
jgi:hypothetical protein